MEFLAGLYTLLLVAICLLQALLLHRTGKPAAQQDDEALKEWLRQQLEAQARVLEEKQAQQAQQNLAAMAHISDTLQTAVQGMSSTLTAGQNTQQQTMEQRLQGLEASNARKLEEMRKALADGLAADVGGLKQVLSGVKTRGILGEIQLGAILEEILAPEQYDTNVATIPGSTQRVEYAIRMPGVDGNSVWLPIDSKFPGDTYAHLQDAQASGDAQAVENARHALELVLRAEAKDIREKYVEPPYTTAFGILFLPFEGLYAEVVNAGLLEVLQRDYQVNVAGPSTMAALLNSLQMGFKTLAIQKRSGEVWQLLGAVKTEFDKFGQGLSKMQQRLRQTDEELDNLIGVRSRAISRKLRAVQTLDENTAATLLELDTEPGRPVTARLPESGEEL